MSTSYFLNLLTAQPESRVTDHTRRKSFSSFTNGLVGLVCWLALIGPVPAQAQLESLFRITDGSFANRLVHQKVDLSPGQEMTLADIKGPGKITYFFFTDDSHYHPTEGTGFMYPGLVIDVFWDNASQPSIRVPLWNFFGAFGRKTIDYQSLPMQINHYCYASYLPMPFSTGARFVLVNDGDEEYSRSISCGIDYEKDAAFAAEKSRLHAAWNRSNPTRNSIHQLLKIIRKGQYVGDFLQVNTKYEGWWGEGDTIFYLDGKKITHAPGTEDEYGSCWGFDHIYSYLYSGYLQMEDGENRMYRWYLTNPVRFEKSLTVQIQDKRNESGKQVPSHDDYTSVAFWYQEGAHPAPRLLPYTERIAPTRGSAYPRTK